jgi:hypothetical protein
MGFILSAMGVSVALCLGLRVTEVKAVVNPCRDNCQCLGARRNVVEGERTVRASEGFFYSNAIGRGERNLSASEGSVVGSGDDAVEFTGFDKFCLGEEGLLPAEQDSEQNKQDKAGGSR